jgi:hypothetical protein
VRKDDICIQLPFGQHQGNGLGKGWICPEGINVYTKSQKLKNDKFRIDPNKSDTGKKPTIKQKKA